MVRTELGERITGLEEIRSDILCEASWNEDDGRLCFSWNWQGMHFKFIPMKLSLFEKSNMITGETEWVFYSTLCVSNFGSRLVVLFHSCRGGQRHGARVTILIRNSLKSLTLQVKQRIIDVDTKNSLGDYLRSGHSFSKFSTVSVLKCYEYLKFYDYQVWSVTSRNCLTTRCKFFSFFS